MAAGSPLLQMEQVNKWFGDLHVLQDVDLEVDPGEVVVVVGPSGSGKSTLCRTINRLEPIDGGTIRLEGRPLPSEGRALARLRSDVGMVFQQFNLFAHRTVLDNVTLGPIKVRGQSRQQAPAGPSPGRRPRGHGPAGRLRLDLAPDPRPQGVRRVDRGRGVGQLADHRLQLAHAGLAGRAGHPRHVPQCPAAHRSAVGAVPAGTDRPGAVAQPTRRAHS